MGSEMCIRDSLYGVTSILEGKTLRFEWGELGHGKKGLIEEYSELFEVPKERVPKVLQALATKRRIANKIPCPHCDKQRLGGCPYHHLINKFRKILSRSQYRKHEKELL